MTEEKLSHLFIGGPWDGRRLVIDPAAPFITAPPGDDSDVGVLDVDSHGDQPQRLVRYRRAALRAPGREWVVFAAEDVADGDVIGRLIDGYSVAGKS